MIKILPHSEEAEKTTLGSLLVDSATLYDAIPVLDEEDFYYPPHKTIFNAIKSLYSKNKPIDILTVSEFLRENNLLDRAGGVSYITELAEKVPTTANFDVYLEIVKEKSIRRSLVKIANQLIAKAGDNSLEIKDIINFIESNILNITDLRHKDSFKILKDLLWGIIEDIEKRLKDNNPFTGIQTGYQHLDDLTSGFQKGQLIVIAARPSIGKTTFALNLAANMSFKYDYNVAFFSLEMPAESLGYKIISRETRIPFDDIRKGHISLPKLSEMINQISNIVLKNLVFEDSNSLTVFDIQQKARRLKLKHNLDAIFIDYLQIIAPPKGVRPENRNVIVSEISKGLKNIARELKIPVIVLSQLSRFVERREDKRPMLSDLRESGAIEQDADIVAFLYSQQNKKDKESIQPDINDNKNIVELIIGKFRNGRRGRIFYKFHKEISLFEEISISDEVW